MAYRSQLAALRSAFVALVQRREHLSSTDACAADLDRQIAELSRRIDALVGFEAPQHPVSRLRPVWVTALVLLSGAALVAVASSCATEPRSFERIEILCTF